MTEKNAQKPGAEDPETDNPDACGPEVRRSKTF